MGRSDPTDEILSWQIQPSDVGWVWVAWSAQGVRAIVLADNEAALLAERQAHWHEPCSPAPWGDVDASAHPWVMAVLNLIAQPASEEAQNMSPPLDVRGTAFQKLVWAALRQIPPGQTVSYSELAQRLGQPRAVRAVAGACAANVLAVVIPCHRVVRRDGGLSGYRWGVSRKQALLQREASH